MILLAKITTVIFILFIISWVIAKSLTPSSVAIAISMTEREHKMFEIFKYITVVLFLLTFILTLITGVTWIWTL